MQNIGFSDSGYVAKPPKRGSPFAGHPSPTLLTPWRKLSLQLLFIGNFLSIWQLHRCSSNTIKMNLGCTYQSFRKDW